jgi:hypothetical protein
MAWAMQENHPEDHPSALEGSAAPEPALTEPEDLIAALEAWNPEDSAAPDVDAAEEEMEHVHVVARHPNEPWVIVQGWDRDNRKPCLGTSCSHPYYPLGA